MEAVLQYLNLIAIVYHPWRLLIFQINLNWAGSNEDVKGICPSPPKIGLGKMLELGYDGRLIIKEVELIM